MDQLERNRAFREIAGDLEGIDLPVYQRFGKDPCEPVIGEGAVDARVAIFGRDPGAEEIRHGMPFIGAGGQKVRATMYRVLQGAEMPDFEASLEVGRFVFWANTAPYKPVGNKAWSNKVKRRFQPLIADLLLHAWRGRDVITLGREAFLWFGLGADKAAGGALETFWKRADRFEQSLEWGLTGIDGASRKLRLHPLPHPSPLNATWYKRFPELLDQRLRQLDFSLDHWRLV